MHKLYRTPLGTSSDALWALNNPMHLKAGIRPIRLVRIQKAPNCSENDLAHFSLEGGMQSPMG